MRAGKLNVTVMSDALGKPYVDIDSDSGENGPVRIVVWADEIRVQDLRPKAVKA